MIERQLTKNGVTYDDRLSAHTDKDIFIARYDFIKALSANPDDMYIRFEQKGPRHGSIANVVSNGYTSYFNNQFKKYWNSFNGNPPSGYAFSLLRNVFASSNFHYSFDENNRSIVYLPQNIDLVWLEGYTGGTVWSYQPGVFTDGAVKLDPIVDNLGTEIKLDDTVVTYVSGKGMALGYIKDIHPLNLSFTVSVAHGIAKDTIKLTRSGKFYILDDIKDRTLVAKFSR